MALDEVDLQSRELVFANADVAERSEAGGDAVDRLAIAADFLVEVTAAAADALLGILAEL